MRSHPPWGPIYNVYVMLCYFMDVVFVHHSFIYYLFFMCFVCENTQWRPLGTTDRITIKLFPLSDKRNCCSLWLQMYQVCVGIKYKSILCLDCFFINHCMPLNEEVQPQLQKWCFILHKEDVVAPENWNVFHDFLMLTSWAGGCGVNSNPTCIINQ